jgi:hypothetical protein
VLILVGYQVPVRYNKKGMESAMGIGGRRLLVVRDGGMRSTARAGRRQLPVVSEDGSVRDEGQD